MHTLLFALVNLRKPKPRISRPHLLPLLECIQYMDIILLYLVYVAAHNVFHLTVNFSP